jgi:serine phosphatase RsbU (regulator of sigma subunit)/anti-sigma regulatory factor (Ser/Thr protein kinase)
MSEQKDISQKAGTTPRRGKMSLRGVVSMRLIMTAATVALIIGAVLGVGGVAENNVRRVLTRELETRLVLEARNLALLSSSAMLSDYPELVLHPVVKEMRAERPDLATILVLDRHGIIQGHEDAQKLGTEFKLNAGLRPLDTSVYLHPRESLSGNTELVVVQTPVLHPNGEVIGKTIVGMERTYVEALLADARAQQHLFLLIILAGALLLTPFLMSVLLRPIRALRAGLERIGQGDLDSRLELSSMTELGLLAASINNMASKLKSAQASFVEKERLDHEMELARQIQQSLVPKKDTVTGDFMVAGSQRAAEEVGGDYYDVFPLQGGRIGLVVADVSGKGLGGCMVTSMLAVLIKTLSPAYSSPRALMIALQDSLMASLQPGTFVTMFYGILNSESGGLTYASAGHNPLFHYKAATGKVEWHETAGIPLGIAPGKPFGQSLTDDTLDIEPGDTLVQYTDGFSEAISASKEEFGLERLSELVGELAPAGGKVVIAGLQDAVDEWEESQAPSDDKTLLVLWRSGQAHKTGINPDQIDQMLAHRANGRNHLEMESTLEALDDIGCWLKDCTYLEDMPQQQHSSIEQGLYEVCSNIVEHGYDLDPNRAIDIWWIAEGDGDSAAVKESSPGLMTALELAERIKNSYFIVRDYGSPPDTGQFSSPELRSYKVLIEGRGLGMRIIHEVFEEIEFYRHETEENLTVLRLKMPAYQNA